jgi:hypothetical protein
MKRVLFLVFAIAVVTLSAAGLMAGMFKGEDPRQHAISTYHGDPQRSGAYVVPGLTFDRVRALHLDTGFHAEIAGHIHAQPLYWTLPGSQRSLLIVATEENGVYALDAQTGQTIWKRELGPPVGRAALQCTDIVPLGITGTPVIDPASEAVYLDAAVTRHGALHHLVFALSLKDGLTLPGWPIDVAEALTGQAPDFAAAAQNQRGALLILAGKVFVPYGGFFDCGTYRGTVVGISLSDPRTVTRWTTRAVGGGVWAPGGIVADDTSLLLATGNTFYADEWQDGEAVIRLAGDLQPSAEANNFFTPTDWHALDEEDSDLGGIAPLVIVLPGETDHRRFVLALGKDGKAYLLDHDNLGGVGGEVAVAKVSARGIYAAAVAYTIGDTVYVAFPASGTDCPKDPAPHKGLAVLTVRGHDRPELATAWCAQVLGLGAPIVTTSDGAATPIVWVVGAEGDNRLHAFRGDTGESLLGDAAPALKGLHRFQTLIATKDHLFVAADDTVYAFKF